MSKVVIEIDTEEETTSVSVDGAALSNVESISIYPGMGKHSSFGLNIYMCEEEGDMRKVTTLYCNEDGEIVKKKNTVHDQLVQAFEKNRK